MEVGLLQGNNTSNSYKAPQIDLVSSVKEERKCDSGVNIDTERAVGSMIGASGGNIIG